MILEKIGHFIILEALMLSWHITIINVDVPNSRSTMYEIKYSIIKRRKISQQ